MEYKLKNEVAIQILFYSLNPLFPKQLLTHISDKILMFNLRQQIFNKLKKLIHLYKNYRI
jgi:hypothetical protein